MFWIIVNVLCVCELTRTQVIPGKARTDDGEYNTVNTDGSFDFGYKNKDRGSSYHLARGNANRVVGGRFGARDPVTGNIKETVYTAGPRGFRAKGPNVHRNMDLDQRPRGPIGNKDDPYYDPNEDPSYGFKINTATYSKSENADRRGDVKGHYTYIDDVGERHDVSYIAGRDTGFHVSSAHPDSPNLIAAPFHHSPLVRGEARPRGRTAVQRGLDGSYRFISAGPDQRRTESSDANGNVRGSYTFLDDKGIQRTVHYIAGPGIGYRIVKSGKDPYIPAYFPSIPSVYDPDLINTGGTGYGPDSLSDDIFKSPDGTAASGHVKPSPFTASNKDRSKAGEPKYSDSNEHSNEVSREGLNKSSFEKGNSNENGFIDEEVTRDFGDDSTPNKRPGKPSRPTISPYRPQKNPYIPLKPNQLNNNRGSINFKSQKGYRKEYNKEKNIENDGYDDGKDNKNVPQFAIGFNVNHNKHGKPGTTIIKNIGEDYFGVPPGVSVRAHVQSIDLYPFDSKPISPSEALEKDKT